MALGAGTLNVVMTVTDRLSSPVDKGIRSVERSANRMGAAERAAGRLEGRFGSLGRSANRAFSLLSAGALALGLKRVFDLGAAVEETASKYATVFGPAVGQVNRFLDEFAVKAGLSRQEAQDLTATAGQITQGFGATIDQSAALSERIIRLAGDFASFGNKDIVDTFGAIKSALVGQTEPLDNLGVVIRVADVNARALGDTGKRTAAQLTQLEKAEATLTLITERMGAAYGDLDRTQLSAANTARRVRARFVNLRDHFASQMLPTLGLMVGAVDENADTFHALEDAITSVFRFFRKFSAGIQLLAVDFAVLGARVDVWKAKFVDAIASGLGQGADKLIGFVRFIENLPGPVKLLLGLNPVGFGGFKLLQGLANALGAGDTAGAVTRAEKALNDMEEAAAEMRLEIVAAFDAAENAADNAAAAANRQAEALKNAADAAKALRDAELTQTIDLLNQKARFGDAAIQKAVGGIIEVQGRTFAQSGPTFRQPDRFVPEPQKITPIQAPGPSTFDRVTGGLKSALDQAGAFARDSFRGVGIRAADLASKFTPLGLVSELLGSALEAVQPALQALLVPVTILGRVLGTALLPIIEALFPVIKGLAIAATYVGQVLFNVAGGLAKALGAIITTIGKLIDKIPFVSGKGIIKFGEGIEKMGSGMLDSAKKLGEAREEIRGLSFESALEELGNTAEKVSEQLLFLPQGFKLAAAIFDATEVGAPSGGGGGGSVPLERTSGGGGLYVENLHVDGADDPETALANLKEALRLARSRGEALFVPEMVTL